MRIGTALLAPGGDQYGGKGQPPLELSSFTSNAAELEELGFDNLTMPEYGHDPFVPWDLPPSTRSACSLRPTSPWPFREVPW